MVDLHRWLKKTSPHLVIAGSLVITGLSGCRSAQYTAVEVEAGPTTYPAPLIVPEAAPPSEPGGRDTASSTYEDDGDLLLKPPAPPLAEAESNSGTGTPPKLPLPEIDTPERPVAKDLSTVKPKNTKPQTTPEPKVVIPEPKVVAKDTASTTSKDPLNEANLFPDDNPNPVGDPAATAKKTVAVVKDTGTGKKTDSATDKKDSDPFVETFEPTVANPEVPVPNPGKNTVSVKKPESDLTPVEPLRKKVTEEPETPTKSSSKLFPPPKVDLPLPKIESQEKVEKGKADKKVGTDKGDAAALPVITPTIVATKPKPKPPAPKTLPQLDVKKPIEPKQTAAIDRPQQDQLASIAKPDVAKPDGKLRKADLLTTKRIAKPLFPKISLKPNKSSPPQDAISVVAEVWSPADNVVFDNSGNAFVSHGKHISKVASDGTVEPWATMGSPRGHVILPDGSHLVADAGQRAIVKLNEAGEQVRKVATRSDGDFLRAPNDLVTDSKGGVYFTDPGYARIRNPIGRIHYAAADGSVTVVAQHLAFPEGIALSADGSKLLVVESQARQVVEFEIRSPGEVGPKQVFAAFSANADDQIEGFANGLLVDTETGRVFVAHGDRQQVEMLSPEGKSLRSFEMGATINGIAFKPNDTGRLFAAGGARSGKKDAGQVFEVRIAD